MENNSDFLFALFYASKDIYFRSNIFTFEKLGEPRLTIQSKFFYYRKKLLANMGKIYP